MKVPITKYHSKLSLLETEVAIKKLKDFFERELSKDLNLTRVSAPLFVEPNTGLNDNLNGTEKAVSFNVDDTTLEIVHSLAKWKRMALYKYGFNPESGLYTDMNAIRKNEELSNIHSYYVDQWDWEKVIEKKERTEDKLIEVVNVIYEAFKKTSEFIKKEYDSLEINLPEEIKFITSQELENLYPNLESKERENEITKKYKAVFLMKIGKKLNSGEVHDNRAPDYDDWELNGDIIFWNPILNQAFELSSMGIRVDKEALEKQLKECDCEDRKELEFHSLVLKEKLPYTIGGGIGQSRICMFFLEKAHIGEVQASYWPKEIIDDCKEKNIFLL